MAQTGQQNSAGTRTDPWTAAKTGATLTTPGGSPNGTVPAPAKKEAEPDKPATDTTPKDTPKPASDSKTVKIHFTHYDNDKPCTGKSPGDPGWGITTDGTKAAAGTLAAPKNYPFGIVITWTDPQGNEHTGVVHDRGGAIKNNRIDIWVPTHAEAVQRGWYEVNATVTFPKPE